VAVLSLALSSCVVSGRLRQTDANPTPTEIGQLWLEPRDLPHRDLFHGPGSAELMPRPSSSFTFVAADNRGYSPGYDVRDARGMEWSVKIGPEAQPEVVASRILWALGYHQPPTYYVSDWILRGHTGGRQPAARFRPKLPNRKVVGEWSWYDNQFLTTRAFKNLLVVNLLLNNWDWKTSNNKVYEIARRNRREPARVFVVQDLGASLGKTSYPTLLAWLPMRGLGQGSRNDLEDFESQGFVKRIEGDEVTFDYRGIHHALVDTLTPDDVRAGCELVARLSERQWHDAFKAAGYTPEHSRRYVVKIRSKLAEGLTVPR
jgi:hypothetical protein